MMCYSMIGLGRPDACGLGPGGGAASGSSSLEARSMTGGTWGALLNNDNNNNNNNISNIHAIQYSYQYIDISIC